jgi:hypothetical protein
MKTYWKKYGKIEYGVRLMFNVCILLMRFERRVKQDLYSPVFDLCICFDLGLNKN